MNKNSVIGLKKEHYEVLRVATIEEVKKYGPRISKPDKGKYYLCKCECGNFFVAQSSWIKNDLRNSCGCVKSKTLSELKREDISCKQFGKLTALFFMKNDKYRHALWYCTCECGAETVVSADNMKRSHTRSCGCEHSAGEMQICELLSKRNVSFCREYSFDDLRSANGGLLKFDFAFTRGKTIIALLEYQGVQHYRSCAKNPYFGYQQRVYTDKQKKEYCEKNNIPLFEIRYDEDVELAIDKIIEKLNVLQANTVPSAA